MSDLIQREQPTDEFTNQLYKIGEFINEIVDYGETIYDRIVEADWYTERHAPLSALLVHILDLADSISIIIKKGSRTGASALLRSLFEASVSFIYMINVDEGKGVLAYQVAHANHELTNLRKFDIKQPNGKNFIPKFEVYTEEKWKSLDFSIEGKGFLDFLDKPEIRPINQEYRSLKNGKTLRGRKRRSGIPNWYTLFDGPENLESLSQKVDQILTGYSDNNHEVEILYHLIYKPSSRTVHGTGTMTNIVPHEEEGMAIIPGIRNPQNINNEGTMTAQLLLKNYQACAESVSTKSVQEFWSWYQKHIQEELHNINKVKLNVDWESST